MKPTREQIIEALCFFGNTNMVTYNEKDKLYTVVELIPKPHYDSGHGIDAIDFDEHVNVLTNKEAQADFRRYKNMFNNKVKHKPVSPRLTTKVEDLLPF